MFNCKTEKCFFHSAFLQLLERVTHEILHHELYDMVVVGYYLTYIVFRRCVFLCQNVREVFSSSKIILKLGYVCIREVIRRQLCFTMLWGDINHCLMFWLWFILFIYFYFNYILGIRELILVVLQVGLWDSDSNF